MYKEQKKYNRWLLLLAYTWLVLMVGAIFCFNLWGWFSGGWVILPIYIFIIIFLVYITCRHALKKLWKECSVYSLTLMLLILGPLFAFERVDDGIIARCWLMGDHGVQSVQSFLVEHGHYTMKEGADTPFRPSNSIFPIHFPFLQFRSAGQAFSYHGIVFVICDGLGGECWGLCYKPDPKKLPPGFHIKPLINGWYRWDNM